MYLDGETGSFCHKTPRGVSQAEIRPLYVPYDIKELFVYLYRAVNR